MLWREQLEPMQIVVEDFLGVLKEFIDVGFSGGLMVVTNAGAVAKLDKAKKEARKWRKGFRYVVVLCSGEAYTFQLYRD